MNKKYLIKDYYSKLPDYHYEDNTDGIINNPATPVLRGYKIYGNSEQYTHVSRNLISYPYYETTKTINGITFTDNGDGTITANGTLTGTQADFFLTTGTELNTSDTYFLSGSPENSIGLIYGQQYIDGKWSGDVADRGNGTKMTIGKSAKVRIWIRIYGEAGAVCDNLIFKPQLELGSAATEHDPYGDYPSPSFPSDIENVGDKTPNLFDEKTILPSQGWVKQADGSWYVEAASTPHQKVLWQNTEGYTGRIKLLWKFKYAKPYEEAQAGVSIRRYYTDGTNDTIWLSFNNFEGNTWYSPNNAYVISNASKVVDRFEWAYGTGSNSTWVKDIIITKDLTVTDYEPYGYRIPISIVGKNLFDITKCVDYNPEKGCIFLGTNVERYRNQGKLKNIANVEAGKTYVISAQSTSTVGGLYVYLGGSKRVWTFYNNPASATKILELTQEDLDGGIYFYKSDYIATAPDEVIISDIQIEENKEATDYASYQGHNVNIYLDEPLRRVGDASDYIDFVNKQVVRKIGKFDLNGDVIRYDWLTSHGIRTKQPAFSQAIRVGQGLSNRESIFDQHNREHALWTLDYYIYWINILDILGIYDSSKTDDAMIAEFKEWIENNPTYVYYILTTPLLEPIDLPYIELNKDFSNITIGTKISPSNINYQYYKK